MGKDGLIFSNRFEQPDFNEILKAVEQNRPKEKRNGAGSGDDFFSFMREHRKLIPRNDWLIKIALLMLSVSFQRNMKLTQI